MISRWARDKEKLYTVGVGTGTTCGCGGWRRRPGGRRNKLHDSRAVPSYCQLAAAVLTAS